MRTILGVLMLAGLAGLGTADDAMKLEPKKVYKDEIVGEMRPTPWPEYVDSYYGYMVEIPVTLKAGDKISIVGTVAGQGRRMAIALVYDKTGKIVAATKRNADVGATRLSVSKVAASGDYTIRVVSSDPGLFTVTADFPQESDEKALEANVARLKRELADAEAKLKDFRDKKK